MSRSPASARLHRFQAATSDWLHRHAPSPQRRYDWFAALRLVSPSRRIAVYGFLLKTTSRGVAVGMLALVVIVLAVLSFAYDPGTIPTTGLTTAGVKFAPDTPHENGVTDGDRALLRGMDLMTPLRPPLPPPQLVPPPAEQGLLSLGSRRAEIVALARALAGNAAGADAAQTAPELVDAPPQRCPDDSVSIGGLSGGGDSETERPGIETYHVAIARLCNHQSGDAEQSFRFAEDWFARVAARNGNDRRLIQYRAAALYGRALALADWGDVDGPAVIRPGDAEAAGKACNMAQAIADLETAYKLMAQIEREPARSPGQAVHAFAPADWRRRGLLLPLSTADLLDARLWIELRARLLPASDRCQRPDGEKLPAAGRLDAVSPKLVNRVKAALRDGAGDGSYRSTVMRPSLAGNLAVFAMVASRPASDEDRGFFGDIQGVRQLYSDFNRSDPNVRDPEAGRRILYMASVAGAPAVADAGAAPLTCRATEGSDAAGRTDAGAEDRDARAITAVTCLQAMVTDMDKGDAIGFHSDFKSLKAKVGSDPAYLKAARARAVDYRPALAEEEARQADGYWYLTAILADGELFGWSALAPWLRLHFGPYWPGILPLAALLVLTALWMLVKRQALLAARERLLASRHHDERVRKQAMRPPDDAMAAGRASEAAL